MVINNLSFRAPSDAELLEVARFSFENFVKELARSSGQPESLLREKYGAPPSHRSENDFWLLIEHGKKRVGFVWFEINPKERSAFGWDIYLEPEFRSKGIGRYVMQMCGEELLRHGIHSVKICVFEHNKIARRLYESLGFIEEKFDEQRRQFTLSLKLN